MDEVTIALVSGAPRPAVGGSGDGRLSRTRSHLTIACGDQWAECREPQSGGLGPAGLGPQGPLSRLDDSEQPSQRERRKQEETDGGSASEMSKYAECPLLFPRGLR